LAPPAPDSLRLPVPTLRQPDDVSCGPTSLLKVLLGYGDERTFEDVEAAVSRNPDGGTLGVFLAQAALSLGYDATLYSYNLRIFDPTWAELSPPRLVEKLRERIVSVEDPRLQVAEEAYASFIESGGRVCFDDLDAELLLGLLRAGRPVICGLSATYLYRTPREIADTGAFDDVGGEPSGHFLVVVGYADAGASFIVSDPYRGLPLTSQGTYEVGAQRLLNAILLGVMTYDGVLVVVEPRSAS
jgi:hypothetical protein